MGTKRDNPDNYQQPSSVENKKKIFEIIGPYHSELKAHRVFNIVMLLLIFVNILSVVLETEVSLYDKFKPLFIGFEVFSIAVFTVEYVLRLWSCTVDKRFEKPFAGRIKFMLQPMSIIDLISFLPFYYNIIFIGSTIVDLRFVRALRLFRLFRLLKVGRYSQSLSKMGNVIKQKKEELTITLFAGIILLVISSSLMYMVENEAQPDKFSSIPASLWWGVVTLTTVGYGDVYPITILGKIISGCMAVLGIGLFALPAGIIASGFISELSKENKEPVICPHCGKNMNEFSEKQ